MQPPQDQSSPFEMDEVEAWTQAMVGQTLGGRYRLDGVIGIGAMGSVFRGRHLGLERDVALKLLHPQLTANPEMRERFSREAAAASKLDHPNCVRVTDFGITDDGHHFLVMDLLHGSELSEILGDAMPVATALALTDQILAGLEHAHARGLIHRDVKPENIFLTTDDQGRQIAKVVDFGIVKLQEGAAVKQLTQFGVVIGTPQYMSPEQAVGQRIDPRADLYAVGVILYSLLVGHPPFDGSDPVAVLRKQIREPPPPLPDSIDPRVRSLVDRLLAKQPDDRFASAIDARQAIAPLMGSPIAPTATPPPSQPAAGAYPVKAADKGNRKRNIAFLAVGATILSAVVITLITRDDANSSDTDDARAADSAHGGSTKDRSGNAASDEGDTDSVTSRDGRDRALEANLASIDALIAAGKLDAAQIALEPLLSTYGNEAQLHWRMGKVLTSLRAADNRVRALEHYTAALSASPDLIADDLFERELWNLVDDPKLRVEAVDVAIVHLGEDGQDKLLQWLNTQTTPLPYAARRRAMAHLDDAGRGKEINRPLQLALDLWQASMAERPCEAFEHALQAALESPDSYLLGTLQAVHAPTPEEGPCLDAADTLERARDQYAILYAGLDAIVPKAFRKRPATAAKGRR